MKIFKKIFRIFDFNLNLKVKKIMALGIRSNFIFLLFSTLILSIYITSNSSYIIYEVGSSLFKSFSMFIVIFFIFAIAFNQIANELK